MTPKFSVLLSVYHKEKPEYLSMALESIWRNQTLKPSQIVIVKDGPLTLELDKILDSFAEIAPVDFIINEKNIGLSASLNKGLVACKNELVARMDTDDIAMPERFEKQVSFFEKHPNIDILGTFAIRIDEHGNEFNLLKVPTQNDDIIKYIWTCPMIHPTVMFKKNKIIEVGSYNVNSGPRQDDYELWFRCAFEKLSFANISEPLLMYRFFVDSIKKNDFKVGLHRFKVGLNGCKKLNAPPIAYLGITIPFIRSLLPYPLSLWFQNLMNRFNPRSK